MRIKAVSFLLITLFSVLIYTQARADMFNSSYQYSGGVFKTPSSGGNSLGVNAGITGKVSACGGLNIVTAIPKQMERQLQGIYSNLVGFITGGLPIALLCYISPTLCNIYKHFNAMLEAGFRLSTASCESIEKASMDYADQKLKNRDMENCAFNLMSSGGATDYTDAAKQCSEQLSSGFSNTVDFSGNAVSGTDYNVTQKAIGSVSGSLDSDTVTLLNKIMPQMTFTSMGGSKAAVPSDTVATQYMALRDQYYDEIKTAVETVKGGGTADLSDCESRNFHINYDVLKAVGALNDNDKDIAVQKLASDAAAAKRIQQVQDAITALRKAEQTKPEGSADTKELKSEVEMLKSEVDDMMWQKKQYDELNADAAQIINKGRRVAEYATKNTNATAADRRTDSFYNNLSFGDLGNKQTNEK